MVRGRDLARRVAGRGAVVTDADTTLQEVIGLSPDLQYVRLRAMSDLRLRTRLMGSDPVADQDAFLLDVLDVTQEASLAAYQRDSQTAFSLPLTQALATVMNFVAGLVAYRTVSPSPWARM